MVGGEHSLHEAIKELYPVEIIKSLLFAHFWNIISYQQKKKVMNYA